MIDAAGTIYVIGGYSGGSNYSTYFNDVWASTDGGADPTASGVIGGYWAGTLGVLRGEVLEG